MATKLAGSTAELQSHKTEIKTTLTYLSLHSDNTLSHKVNGKSLSLNTSTPMTHSYNKLKEQTLSKTSLLTQYLYQPEIEMNQLTTFAPGEFVTFEDIIDSALETLNKQSFAPMYDRNTALFVLRASTSNIAMFFGISKKQARNYKTNITETFTPFLIDEIKQPIRVQRIIQKTKNELDKMKSKIKLLPPNSFDEIHTYKQICKALDIINFYQELSND